MAVHESKWWIPALVASLAIPTFVAFWIGGDRVPV
jgi:hypothetical protein